MPPAPPPAEQLFDMFLLGLTWLRDDKPEVLARPGGSVFNALRHANVFSEGQRRLLARNTSLISYAIPRSEVIKAKRRPRKSQIEERIGTSEQLLLTLVVPEEALQFTKLFGPKGYLHVVTDAGVAYARSVAAKYDALIDHPRFAAGWQGFVSQVRAVKARQPGKKVKAADAVGTSSQDDDEAQQVNITRQAPYSESDFEW